MFIALMERQAKSKSLIVLTQSENLKLGKLALFEKNKDKIMEYRMAAYAEACLDNGFKPNGEIKERVEFILNLPTGIRGILYENVNKITSKRLPEKIEEIKKE